MDFRYRLKENKARPKAIELLRNSLNLSRTFFVQINNITDKDEIYTSRDLEELQTIINETTVNKFRGSTSPLKLTLPPPSPPTKCLKSLPYPSKVIDVPLTEKPPPPHPYFLPRPHHPVSHKIETFITVKASRKRENLLLLSLRILLTDLKSRSQPEQSSGTLKRKQKSHEVFLLFLCLQEWLDANVKKQSEAKSSDNPVLVVKDIEAKQGKLDRELLYLLNKAKYYVPKPKVNETGTNHVFFTSTVSWFACAARPI